MGARTIIAGLPGQAPPPEKRPATAQETAGLVRSQLQELVRDLDDNADKVERLLYQMSLGRSWTVLKRGDGSTFATFAEFCDWPRPHGLGFPFAKLRPYWEKALTDSGVNGAKAVALATVDPAKPTIKARGEGGLFESPEDGSYHDDKNGPTATPARLRAILRAPEPAVDLYKQDLLSQVVAARLGPKNPTPEQAAEVTAAARKAADIVKAAPKPATEKAKRALRRKVDEAVKGKLSPKAAPAAAPPPAPPAFDPLSPAIACPGCGSARPPWRLDVETVPTVGEVRRWACSCGRLFAESQLAPAPAAPAAPAPTWGEVPRSPVEQLQRLVHELRGDEIHDAILAITAILNTRSPS